MNEIPTPGMGRIVLPWWDLPRPLPWPRIFGRPAPLVVEIGFGNGEYLVRCARENPEHDFVGLDVVPSRSRRAMSRVRRAGLTNVRLLHIEARVAFERLFAPGTIHRVLALFPCPWPKPRHHKHRLFDHAFLRLVNSRLEPRGEVRIVTDHEEFAAWIEEQLFDTGFEAARAEIEPRFGTRYENKFRRRGHAHFFALDLVRRSPAPAPLKEDVSMQTHRIARFDPDRFRPRNLRGEITVEFRDFLFDPVRRRGMVLAAVAEPGLVQELWIDIRGDENGWAIRPARGCRFIPTEGVQRALDLTRDAGVI